MILLFTAHVNLKLLYRKKISTPLSSAPIAALIPEKLAIQEIVSRLALLGRKAATTSVWVST